MFSPVGIGRVRRCGREYSSPLPPIRCKRIGGGVGGIPERNRTTVDVAADRIGPEAVSRLSELALIGIFRRSHSGPPGVFRHTAS